MTSLVMTILGADRPGVVESVAEIVNEHGANWLESRMAHLAGQFAGIVHVEVNPGKVDALIEALRSLDQQGLTVIVQAEAGQETHDSFAPLQLEVVGSDQPGPCTSRTATASSRGCCRTPSAGTRRPV